MMTSNLWSWIFIFQMFSIRPGCSLVIKHSNDLVARQIIQDIFIRNLSRAEKTRRTFIGLAIGLSLVLFAGIIGLFLYIRQQRQKNAVMDPETTATVDEKPNWWMVEGKNEKMDWWRLSFQNLPSRDPTDRSRIERLKAALKIKNNRNQPILPTHTKTEISPVETINLPIQPIPSILPHYPDVLEKGYRAPVYPTQYIPPVTALPRTVYDNKPVKQNPNLPSELYINPKLTPSSLARSNAERRTGVPRSPAHRRRSFLSRHHLRHPHPFIPLKDSDARLIISAPMPVDPSNLSHSKLAPVDLSQPRAAPKPPTVRRSSLKGSRSLRPPPLNLGNDNTQTPPRRVRFGLSPRFIRE